MKKILLFLLPLFFVDCSSDEPVIDDEVNEEEPIAFYSDTIIDGVSVKFAYKNPNYIGKDKFRNSYIVLDFKQPYKILTPFFNVVDEDGTIHNKNIITGNFQDVTITDLEYLKDIPFNDVSSVGFYCNLHTDVYDLENKTVHIRLYNKGEECDSVLRMFFK